MEVKAYKKFVHKRTHSFPYYAIGEYEIIDITMTSKECCIAESKLNEAIIYGNILSYLIPGWAGFVISRIADKLDTYASGIQRANRGGGVKAQIGIPLPGLSLTLDTFQVTALGVVGPTPMTKKYAKAEPGVIIERKGPGGMYL